jgi:hypothetical protein
MDMQEGMRARLLNGSGVSGNVSWGQRPQGSSLPAIVLQIVSDSRPSHLKDYQKLRSTIVQMDVYAATYAAALNVARSAIAIMKVPTTISGKIFSACFVDRQTDTVETSGTVNIHRQSVDFDVWHIGD